MQRNIQPIFNKIKELHSGDQEQLETIFSDRKRVIVEAPAGYGKTVTMISKIAYLIAANKVPNPKKILALTFSVNAAYKIRKSIAESLPNILSIIPISPVNLKNKVFTTNYHGFCRKILQLYGRLIHPKLKNINLLKSVDDSDAEKLTNMEIGLSYDEAEQISNYNEAVKERNIEYLRSDSSMYLKNIKTFFLPNNFIPFNAILIFVLELFSNYEEILKFYRSYFPVLIVDEFQDTNILSWALLQKLIIDKTQIMLLGDSLQRIYGFIGAIPNLISKAQKKYDMHKIELKTNYRFKDNETLLLLDKNIRENTKDLLNTSIQKAVKIYIFEAENQVEEAEGILNLIKELINKENSNIKIALLVKQRGKNIDKILEVFRDNNLGFFYALFSDEDTSYIEFHKKSLNEFIKIMISSRWRLSKAICNRFMKQIKIIFGEQHVEIFDALLILLETYLNKLFTEFKFLKIEEKIEFIKDTLENNSLKQYLGYVDSNLIISTVHGAKGLEWDIVILPDMEQYSFPNWLGLCKLCQFKNACYIEWENVDLEFERKFYDELSIFYVAVTRTKIRTIFSYSQLRIDYRGQYKECNLSCLLKLNGIDASIKKFNS